MLLVMRMLGAGGYRIESACMPGVTAGDAFDREPGAAERAVCFDRFDRVVRARRIETAARPEQRADGELVPADQDISGRSACTCDALPKGREASTQRCRRCFTRGNFCRDDDVDRGQLVAARGGRIRGSGGGGDCARRRLPAGLHRDGQTDARDARVRSASRASRRSDRRCDDRARRSRRTASLLRRRNSAPKRKRRGVGCMAPASRRARRQGTIFLRPLERRRARTFLPPVVFMRARKPVARLRLILLG